jgi:hypothetical protein
VAQPVTVGRQSAQVLAFLALVLPLVLLPVAAYAVAATTLDTERSRLQAAAAQAAEDAVQNVDEAAFWNGSQAAPDPVAAAAAARQALAAYEPSAVVDASEVSHGVLTLAAHERAQVPLAAFLPFNVVTLRATVRVRLVAGFG